MVEREEEEEELEADQGVCRCDVEGRPFIPTTAFSGKAGNRSLAGATVGVVVVRREEEEEEESAACSTRAHIEGSRWLRTLILLSARCDVLCGMKGIPFRAGPIGASDGN